MYNTDLDLCYDSYIFSSIIFYFILVVVVFIISSYFSLKCLVLSSLCPGAAPVSLYPILSVSEATQLKETCQFFVIMEK